MAIARLQKSASQLDCKKNYQVFQEASFEDTFLRQNKLKIVYVVQTERKFVLIFCLGHNTTGKVSEIPAAITRFALLFPPRRACNTNKLSHTDFEGGFISMRYRAE
jgi:hypothetical protein